MHKHTCLNCDKVIGQGDFDCEIDADHDFALCGDCTDAAPLICHDCAGGNHDSHRHEDGTDYGFCNRAVAVYPDTVYCACTNWR